MSNPTELPDLDKQYTEWCERHDLPAHLSREAFDDATSLHLLRAQPEGEAPQAEPVIGAGNPEAAFAAFCDREGYPSDGEMDGALRSAFYEGIQYCAQPAAQHADSGKEALAAVSGKLAAVWQGVRDAVAKYSGKPCEGEPFDRLDELLAAQQAAAPGAPIQMILHCPACGVQHIDAPDERTQAWDNPPHRSHLCHGCGHIWRPADVATEGVTVIQTRGSKDSPAPAYSAPGTPEAPKGGVA